MIFERFSWLVRILLPLLLVSLGSVAWADSLSLAPADAHRFSAEFDEYGAQITGLDDWQADFVMTAFGREDDTRVVETVSPSQALRVSHQLGLGGELRVFEVVEYERQLFHEWYGAGPEGLRLGFVVDWRLAGAGLLVFQGEFNGDLSGQAAASGVQVVFRASDAKVLALQGLLAVDATGVELPAWMEYEDAGGVGVLRLVVDDSQALYPIYIDPVVSGTIPTAEFVDHEIKSAAAFAVSDSDELFYAGLLDAETTFAARFADHNESWRTALPLELSGDISVVAAADDGGVYLAGATGVEGGLLITKLSAGGKVAGRSVVVDLDWADWLLETEDGLYVAGGRRLNGEDAVETGVVKLSKDMRQTAPLWFAPNDTLVEIADGAARDDGILLAGTAEVFGERSLSVWAVGGDGATKWQADLPWTDSESSTGAALRVGTDGSVYATGSLENEAGGRDILTLKFGADGRLLWKTRYDGAVGGDDYAAAIVLDGAGNVLVGGASQGAGGDYDAITLKYFDRGHGAELAWQAVYDGTGAGDDFGARLAVSDTGYVYAAVASWGAGSGLDMVTICYADAGEYVLEDWVARYDAPAGGDQRPRALRLTSNFEVLVAGTSRDATEAGEGVAVALYKACVGCLIDEVCVQVGEMAPGNDCLYCAQVGDEAWTAVEDGDPCDDVMFCNGEDSCLSGECTEHTGDPCTDDGVYCNGPEFCNDIDDICESGPAPICPDDGFWCNGAEACSEDIQDCGHEYDVTNPRCPDDGQFCNGDEICDELNDTCDHGLEPNCPDDGVFCNGLEICDPELNACGHAGYDCPDDGVWCNGAEYCEESIEGCTSENLTTPRCPEDELWCNGFELCDEENDECVSEHGPGNPRCLDDGAWCNGEEYCNEEENDCMSDYPPGADRCPDDPLFCNGEEYCDEELDECLSEYGPGNPLCTDDGAWCNGSEFCNEELDLCDHDYDPDTNPRCPLDTLFCNGEEFCNEDGDLCDHQNVPECPDNGVWCDGAEICDEEDDSCTHEYIMSVNPRCPVNDDYCDGTEFCDESNDRCWNQAVPCGDDGFFCNGDEGCDETLDVCTHTGSPCPDDTLFCNGEESCEEALSQCVHAGNPCHDFEICNEELDQCLEACNGCLIDEVCWGDGQLHPENECLICNDDLNDEDWSFNDGYTCDDGVFCNGEDSCLSGSCAEHAGDPCPDDALWCNGAESCDEDDDQCLHEYDPATNPRCPDDALWCTGIESCDEAADECVSEYNPVTRPRCPDNAQYCDGDEFCNEGGDLCDATGNPCPPGTICEEGEDQCVEECFGCLIGDVCYPDQSLNPANDCLICVVSINPNAWIANDGAACNDGVFCNGDDLCQGSQCDIHAGDPCPDDTLWCNGEEFCDEVLDACDAANVPDCSDDDLWCNGEEFCNDVDDICDVQNVPDCSDDGLWCNGEEFCNEDDNICDTTGDECPLDAFFCNGIEECNEATDSCYSTGDPCNDDGQFCNGDEFCDEGIDSCEHSGDPCEPNEQCDEQQDTCDEIPGDDDDDTAGDDDDTSPPVDDDDDNNDDNDDDDTDGDAPTPPPDDEPTPRPVEDDDDSGSGGCFG
ncbi:MAG: hypothetical protein P9L99_11515 [Candidatus Lernaella stagnicola]|nr:hypothetical protein [Candidatus Lernaella stagnicola]